MKRETVVYKTSNTTPITFILFLVFFILKITETVTWSWWWVTAPLWAPWALIIVLFMLFGLAWGLLFVSALIQETIQHKRINKPKKRK